MGGRSFDLTARITRGAGDEGVLYATGSENSGFSGGTDRPAFARIVCAARTADHRGIRPDQSAAADSASPPA